MSTCNGKRNGIRCGMFVFKCTNCGNSGCEQGVPNHCTQQQFKSSVCRTCSKMGTKKQLVGGFKGVFLRTLDFMNG